MNKRLALIMFAVAILFGLGFAGTALGYAHKTAPDFFGPVDYALAETVEGVTLVAVSWSTDAGKPTYIDVLDEVDELIVHHKIKGNTMKQAGDTFLLDVVYPPGTVFTILLGNRYGEVSREVTVFSP